MIKLPTSKLRELECEDLLDLFVSIVVVFAIWTLILGWNASLYPSGNDAIFLAVPLIRDFLIIPGGWEGFGFRSTIMGGAKILGQHGTFPAMEIGKLLNLTPVGVWTLTVFTLQVLQTTLGLHIIKDLTLLLLKRDSIEIPLTYKIALIPIISFSPFLGWKVAYGHTAIILGTYAFYVAVALVLANKTKRLSMTLLFLSFVSLFQAYASIAQQVVVYAAIFGVPIILGVAAINFQGWKNYVKELVFPFLIVLSVFLISMPRFVEMILHALSSDAARVIGGKSMIFSYTTASAIDWISSIPWERELIQARENYYFLHETNFAFGPLLLLLVLVPFRKVAPLSIAVFFSFFLAITFSMNIAPVPEILTFLVPLIDSFRVPERSMISFSMFFPLLAVSVLFYRSEHLLGKKPVEIVDSRIALLCLGLFAIFLCMVVAPARLREFIIWPVTLFTTITIIRKPNQFEPIVFYFFLAVIAGSSISAFNERLLPWPDGDAMEGNVKQVRSEIVSQQPQLSSSLTRAKVNVHVRDTGINTGIHLGISTLEGYWFPAARYSKLVSSLQGTVFNPAVSSFVFQENDPAFTSLKQLYNVCCSVNILDDQLQTTSGSATAGEAWFSSNLVWLSSFQELGRTLLQHGAQLHQVLPKTMWLLSDDVDIRRDELELSESSACDRSRVISVNAPLDSQTITLEVQSEGNCPLTVSLNYLTILEATYSGTTAGEIRATPFPAYGALTGLMVPQGTWKIRIDARAETPFYATFMFYVGIILFAGVIAYVLQQNSKR
jgi:hypothetical protein|tara:strand:+ start:28516 stop:30849 length:2334 start_codon:yes stop_codon:yes gene_type:complete